MPKCDGPQSSGFMCGDTQQDTAWLDLSAATEPLQTVRNLGQRCTCAVVHAQVMLKQQVLNEMAGKARASGRHASMLLTGDAWYTQQAMRCGHCHAACHGCCSVLAFRHVHGDSIGP